MGSHVGMNHGMTTSGELRHLVGQLTHLFDAVEAGDLRGFRIFRAEVGARPFFLNQVSSRKKEDLTVGSSGYVPLGLQRGPDEQRRTRLGQTGEIKKVILLAKTINVVRP